MRRVCGLAMFVGLVMAVGMAPTTNATLVAPSLTPGDTWTYQTNTSLAPGFFLDGRVTLTVTYHGFETVEGNTFDAYNLSITGTGSAAGTVMTQGESVFATGSWVLTGQETVESAGLKTAASVLDLEANGTLHTNPFPVPFRLSVQNTTTYRFVNDAWRFPLDVGNTTLVRSTMNFTEDVRFSYGVSLPPVHSAGIVSWNVSYNVEAQIGVDTPAGHFDAYRIRETFSDGSFTLFFYAPIIGNEARTETYNGTEPVATSELTGYRYQALEPPRFLGLTASDWSIVVVVVAASSVVVLLLRTRWRRPAPPPRGLPPTPP